MEKSQRQWKAASCGAKSSKSARNEDYPIVELSHMYADKRAMQLVRAAQAVRRDRHDKPVSAISCPTCAAMLTVHWGMPALCVAGCPECRWTPQGALRTRHGSAPDTRDRAKRKPHRLYPQLCPWRLRYSCLTKAMKSRASGKALNRFFADGARTADLMGPPRRSPLSRPSEWAFRPSSQAARTASPVRLKNGSPCPEPPAGLLPISPLQPPRRRKSLVHSQTHQTPPHSTFP